MDMFPLQIEHFVYKLEIIFTNSAIFNAVCLLTAYKLLDCSSLIPSGGHTCIIEKHEK